MKSIFVVTLCLLASLALVPLAFAAEDTEGTVGFGIGLPYGIVGVNYEYSLSDRIAPIVGMGLAVEEFGWSLGSRFYLSTPDETWRFRITGLYGVNTILERGGDYSVDEGFSIGSGVRWKSKEDWGIDFDVFYPFVDIPRGYSEEGPRVKAAVGVYYEF